MNASSVKVGSAIAGTIPHNHLHTCLLLRNVQQYYNTVLCMYMYVVTIL